MVASAASNYWFHEHWVQAKNKQSRIVTTFFNDRNVSTYILLSMTLYVCGLWDYAGKRPPSWFWLLGSLIEDDLAVS
jgi:hypothetical protein